MSPEHQIVEFKINEDLAGRAAEGVWGHPVCLAVVCITTSFPEDHPTVITGAAVLVALLTLFRIRLLEHLPVVGSSSCQKWRLRMLSTLLVGGAIWGALAAWSCAFYGFHHPNTILLLLYHAGIAVAGAPTFVHNLWIARLYLALLFGPAMAVHGLYPDSQRWGPLCAFGLYVLFLSARAVELHEEYTRNQAENRDLRAVAGSDPLTGLPNRLSLLRRLNHALGASREKGCRLAILFVDLDGFKAINDRYSHRVGDLFLCEIAARLAACTGTPDSVFRLGGDEFTFLLTDALAADPARARHIAERVLDVACQPVTIEDHLCKVSASVGLSFFPDHAENPEDLLRAADEAMYEAKRSGTNQLCFAGTRRMGDTRRAGDLHALMHSVVHPHGAVSQAHSDGDPSSTG